MFVPVSRQGLKIRLQPCPDPLPGAIFRYRGTFPRLQGFLLIHEVNPAFLALKKADGNPEIATDMVKAEVLCPDHGYRDYCLFWIEKTFLAMPSDKDYEFLLSKIRPNTNS